MSERYITRRSFAVMVSNLRTTRSSGVVPVGVQPACRASTQPCQPPSRAREGRWGRVLGLWSGGPPATRVSRGNAGCRVAATCLAALALLGAPTPARAGDPTPEPPPITPAIPPEQAPPAPAEGGVISPARALRAFETVRGWLDRGSAPEEPDAALPPAWVSTVVIRSQGRVIARHTETALTDADAAGTLQRAAALAIRRAVSRLEGEPDALRSTRVREGLAGVTLSIELAPTPAVPVAGDLDPSLLDSWIRPGIEGMLVRKGARASAVSPGEMLVSGRGAASTLVGLIAELGEEPALALRPLDELLDRGFSLALFRVVHAAQTTPGGPGLLMHRGGVVAPPISGTDELRSLADSIARHITRRAWPGVERHGLRGDLDPVSGRFEPAVAPPFAQALAAEALLRYARAPGVDAEAAGRARGAGEAILSALAVVERGEPAPWGDAISASACLSALARLEALAVERSPELRGLRDRCLPTVKSAFDPRTGFDAMVPQGARGVVARGLIAAALFEPWEREVHLARAESAIRSVFREIEAGRLLSVMPDLGWAEIELARALGREPGSVQALRGVRESVLDLQLRSGDLVEADRDLLGGIVLDAEGSPLPSWQGLRAVALLASMLGEDSLTTGGVRTGEAPGQIVRLLEMLRFLKQLTAEERAGHMYADPSSAMGGVRASLWDQRMPLTASALGLMAISETLESFAMIGSRAEPAAGRP